MAASVLRKAAGTQVLVQTQLVRPFRKWENVYSNKVLRRRLFGFSKKAPPSEMLGSNIVTTKVKQREMSEEEPESYRERFIPITRRSLIRHLMQDDRFLTSGEKKKFEDFALSLDSVIVNKYHGLLQELKVLFDPINPDKDTMVTRQQNRKEQLDSEFWLLQKLDDVMEKANFHELPKSVVAQALAEHSASEGVLVSVNPAKYDVLRYWALGKETPLQNTPWYQFLYNKFTGRPAPKPITYYKRVVVAVRLKRDHKLMLKIFKEVPVNALEQLVPDGQIRMSKFDRGIIMSSAGIAFLGILAKVVSIMAQYQINWTLIMSSVTCLIGIRAWTVYKNRRNSYLVDLSRMLYYKNVANNRGLLTLLIDRAEDETFKEALLTYTFLLSSKAPELVPPGGSKEETLPVAIGGLKEVDLENQIEEWIQGKVSNSDLEFDSGEAVRILEQLGLLSRMEDHLQVLPLEAAMRNLPQHPHSVLARAQEEEIVEGYDREAYEESEQQYREEDRKSRKIGWS